MSHDMIYIFTLYYYALYCNTSLKAFIAVQKHKYKDFIKCLLVISK